MVKKVKRFIVFLLFSFFYSLLSGKTASASSYEKKLTVYPRSGDKVTYDGQQKDINISKNETTGEYDISYN